MPAHNRIARSESIVPIISKYNHLYSVKIYFAHFDLVLILKYVAQYQHESLYQRFCTINSSLQPRLNWIQTATDTDIYITFE